MESNKRKWKPIWFDWLLLMLFAVALFFGVRDWMETKASDFPSVRVEYVICQKAQRSFFAEENGGWDALLVAGESVSNANGTADLGRVVSVTVMPHTVSTVNNKEVGMVERQGYVDLYVTVQGVGIAKAGDGIRLDDIRIASGMKGDFLIGPYYAKNATVLDVREVGE